MEMVDHVASDIEHRIEGGDTKGFYYVFKDYMVENKAQLLKDNRQFLKSADKKIWQALVKEFFSPVTPFLFLASCVGFYLLYQNFSLETFKRYMSLIPLVGLIGFILTYVVYSKVKKLKRFSVVERLAFPFFAFYELANFIFNFTNKAEDTNTMFWLIVIVSIALTLMLLMFIISIKLFKNYDRRFKNIA